VKVAALWKSRACSATLHSLGELPAIITSSRSVVTPRGSSNGTSTQCVKAAAALRAELRTLRRTVWMSRASAVPVEVSESATAPPPLQQLVQQRVSDVRGGADRPCAT
jgi:hypothetical protein